ncbi:type IV secretion system protein VirB10 [Caulobacter sp. Root1472]|uniref:type IV secretion system protein VirB10 n=1 Tax=Caulobacter sp. Root1472 TaxID=1736470 RepID=UPI000A7016EB|nr:type IV secretion system protein VirB10 [Caulobacter sp. Root1472]
MTESSPPEPDWQVEPDVASMQERAISPVAGRSGAAHPRKWLAMSALIVGCGVFYAATANTDRPKSAKPSSQPPRQLVFFQGAKTPPTAPAPTLASPGPDAPQLLTDRPVPAAPALSLVDEVGSRESGAYSQAYRPPGSPHGQIAETSPLMAYSRQATEPTAPRLMALNHDAPGQERAGTGELDQLRQGSALGRAMARSVGDRNFMILAGTTIPCVLLTAMDTATPGYVSCVVPTDVYSDNGAVVLLEKGSRVLGEYRSAMRQGQRRLFVLWTRAVTPGGVAIALASPGGDALGRAGFDGAVDNHFWTRFGGALMLSIVDDAVFAAAGRQDSSQIVRPSSDAAAVALGRSIGVGPSLTKAQGEKVTIFAAQDFDFSNAYDLRSR